VTHLTATRSNRPLTEFACSLLTKLLTEKQPKVGVQTAGNTSVDYELRMGSQRISISLFNHEIMCLVMDDWTPVSLRIDFTGYSDLRGQPTSTTMERLNGILDRLSAFKVIPSGVRVFRDRDQGLTYIGRLDERIAVGSVYAHSVLIQPRPDQLVMAAWEGA
jgi:hypothetical protein